MVWIGFRNPNRFWLGTHPRNLHIAWCCCKRLAKYLPCEVFIIFGLFDEFHSFAENRRRKGWERYTKGPVWSWMAKHSPKHAQNKIQVQLVWVSKPVQFTEGRASTLLGPLHWQIFLPSCSSRLTGETFTSGDPPKNSDSCHQVSCWSCRSPMHWSAAMHPCSLSFSKTWSLVVRVSQVLHSPFVENYGL